jgi:hypothetical protein
MLLLGYPKIMKIEKRIEFKAHLKSVYEKSLQIQDDYVNSIFISNTIFSQISTLAQEFIIMGRTVWED